MSASGAPIQHRFRGYERESISPSYPKEVRPYTKIVFLTGMILKSHHGKAQRQRKVRYSRHLDWYSCCDHRGLIQTTGYLENSRKSIDDKSRETLKYFDKFNSDKMVTARSDLRTLINSIVEQEKIEIIKIKLTKNQTISGVVLLNKRELSYLNASIKQKVKHSIILRKDINVSLILDFFDGVSVCIDMELCDGKSAKEFFKDYANAYSFYLELYIELFRESNANPKYANAICKFRSLDFDDVMHSGLRRCFQNSTARLATMKVQAVVRRA